MELRQLKYFVEVGKLQSYSLASKSLFITQSNSLVIPDMISIVLQQFNDLINNISVSMSVAYKYEGLISCISFH